MEGTSIGEGGHSGYENAKYWSFGGPKECSEPLSFNKHSEIYQYLCMLAEQKAPKCVSKGLIVRKSSGITHEIIADGGRKRNVKIPFGYWDPICYINLLQSNDPELQSELKLIHLEELRLLFYCVTASKDMNKN